MGFLNRDQFHHFLPKKVVELIPVQKAQKAQKATQRRRMNIIILGMHRAGTSLLAHLVARWGGAAGAAGQLLAGDEWNPRGYWEHLPLTGFNDTLLESVDSAWNAPPADPARVKALAAEPRFRERARELIAGMENSCAAGQPWFWKDPRLTALIPFWEEFWHDPVFVVPVRDPLAVAASLGDRDDLPLSAALLLWQVSMLGVAAHVEKSRRRIYISYEEMLRSPAAGCERLFAFLDEQCGDGRSGRNDRDLRPNTGELAKIVNPEFARHATTESLAESADATAEQKALSLFFERKTSRPDEPFNPVAHPVPPGWHDTLAALHELKRARLIIGEQDDRIRSLRRSVSYRLGRALTKPFRLLRHRLLRRGKK